MSTEAPSTSKQGEQEGNLILEANKEFDSANYEKCLEILDQLDLSDSCINRETLQHNRAVVEFYKSECKDHPTLLKKLKELDIDEADGSASSSLMTACSHPMAKYNKAVIYFHRHMYRTSIETLTPLAEKLDALEKHTAALVAILLLKLLLITNQTSKALAFFEAVQSSNLSPLMTAPDETFLKKNFVRPENFSRIFKILGTLTNLLNGRPVTITEDESTEFSALKAHQYYLMKDFQMAAKQLMKINATTSIEGTRSDETNTCIANNMGVIHLRVRHYAIAAKFFQNAISFDKKISVNIRNSSLYEISGARSCEILYNMGISMLYLRRPKEAFQCFLVPLKSYHSNPRLWLRVAEACIMDHEMKMLADEKQSMASSGNADKDNVHTAKYRHTKVYSSSGPAAVPEPNLEFAALSLRNALTLATFYRTSLESPEAEDEDVSGESESKDWRMAKDQNFCNPSSNVSKDSLDNMLTAIYAAFSYVSLRLGDYVLALEMSHNLLKVEELSDAHRLLAHMYAGEALLMMDKITEAVPHLEPTFVSSLNTFDFETKDWQMKSLDAAQSVVRYNLAVAMVLQGDLDAARDLLAACSHPIVSAKIASLKMYMNMKESQYT